jgi:hypothetical protein
MMMEWEVGQVCSRIQTLFYPCDRHRTSGKHNASKDP